MNARSSANAGSSRSVTRSRAESKWNQSRPELPVSVSAAESLNTVSTLSTAAGPLRPVPSLRLVTRCSAVRSGNAS